MIEKIEVGEVNGLNLIDISYSEILCFRRCTQKHHYKYIRNLQKKQKALPLERGSILHRCIESLYRTGEWKPAHKEYKKEFKKLFEEEREAFGDLPAEVYRLMRGYQNYYKGDKNWKVLGVEVPFKVRLPSSRVVLKGIIDLINEDKMGPWVTEHKTVGVIPDHDYRMMEIQPTLYFYPVNLFLGGDLKGIIYNYLRTKPPTVPPLLKSGGLSKARIDTDVATYRSAIKKHGLDPDDYGDVLERLSYKSFYKRVRIPKPDALVNGVIREAIITGHMIEPYRQKRVLPTRTIIKSCAYDCEFQPLCYAEMYGHDVEYIMKATYEERKDKEVKKDKAEEA